MSESSTDLSSRFGDPDHYECSFLNIIGRSNLRDDFAHFNSSKSKSNSDTYEIARQRFLKLLSQHEMTWTPSNEEYDLDVQLSRIYRHDRHEHLAFMRIQPRGFRAERSVPADVEIVFHVLIGRVVFNTRKISKTMTRGQHVTVQPKYTYSIRCLTEDQPSYLIFRVVNKQHKENSTQSSHKKDSSRKSKSKLRNYKDEVYNPELVTLD